MPKCKICDHIRKLNEPVIPEYNPLSDLFKRYMKAYGVSGRQLAAQMNCTAANVSYLLNRPVKLWTIAEVEEFCTLTHCDKAQALRILAEEMKVKLL